MTRIVAPLASGVLSALGLVVSERRRDLVESVLLAGDGLTREAIAQAVERLAGRGRREMGAPDAELRPWFDLRYSGQAFELTVPGSAEPDPGEMRAAFDRAHAERYGYDDPEAELELVTVRVALALPGADPRPAQPGAAEERGIRPARFGGRAAEARVLGPGSFEADGPAIVELPGSTLVVPPGWHASGAADAVTLER